jgi:hypothetical protein
MKAMAQALPFIYREFGSFINNRRVGVLMEKIFVAQQVNQKLLATEAAVDGAFAETTELMALLLKARQDVNAPLTFADDTQVKLMAAMKALSEARTAMVAVHGELAEAKLRLGIRTSMDCVLPSSVVATAETLRDVG